jgi:hypothetical protein
MTSPLEHPLCYIVVPAARIGERIGIVKRGETGYYQTDLDDGRLPTDATDGESVTSLVRYLNERMGVTEEEMNYMILRSMRKEA